MIEEEIIVIDNLKNEYTIIKDRSKRYVFGLRGYDVSDIKDSYKVKDEPQWGVIKIDGSQFLITAPIKSNPLRKISVNINQSSKYTGII